MTWSRHIRRRGVFMLVTLVLVLALALAACGGRAAHGANGGQPSQQTQQTLQANPSAQDVINADNQIQGDLGNMNDLQSSANTDYSAQENEVQP
jgi:conjugal transfer/entry exclusion protein